MMMAAEKKQAQQPWLFLLVALASCLVVSLCCLSVARAGVVVIVLSRVLFDVTYNEPTTTDESKASKQTTRRTRRQPKN